MANDTLRVVPLNLNSLIAADISTSYIAVGVASTSPVRILQIYNGTNVLIYFSDDGINDKWVLPANGIQVMDFTTNRTVNADGLFMRLGTTIYCRYVGSAPSSGTVFVTYWCGAPTN